MVSSKASLRTVGDHEQPAELAPWDEQSLKLLLHHPERVLKDTRLAAWLREHGGLEAVDTYLRLCPRLSPSQAALLAVVLEHPQATAKEYARLLAVDRSRFFSNRTSLCLILADYLNAWERAEPAPEAWASPSPAPLISWSTPGASRPAPSTSLIGRAEEVASVWMLLQRPDVRLVTLTGPGGIGKTRVALQAADDLAESFADGVCFVALAPLRDPALLEATIAQALGLKEISGHSPHEMLVSYLRDKTLLLVLDNFEQIVEASIQLSELLRAAPGLKMLVTSREPLHLYGEHDIAIPPLSVPAPSAMVNPRELGSFEATQLFVVRAQAVRRQFMVTADNAPTIAAICRELEGLPLAIELAAARSRLFSPEALLERLGSRLALLVGGERDRPERHQTLRAAIDWSYELLSPAEQRLFSQLGIFSGGCRLEAAEAICQTGAPDEGSVAEGLESLLNKSLLTQEGDPDSMPRLLMLESLREYALERADAAGMLGQLQAGHARYYCALAQRAFAELLGPGQQAWLDQLEREANNVRAALRWALDQHTQLAAELAGSLWRFWYLRGHLDEGRQWLEQALPAASEPAARARLLEGLGWLADSQGDYPRALGYYDECLALRRQLDDQPGIAMALYFQGRVARSQGEYQRAASFYQQSLELARANDQRWLMATVLNGLGGLALLQGEPARARGYLEQSLELASAVGDKERLAALLTTLGLFFFQQHDYAEARRYLQQSLDLSAELGNRLGLSTNLTNLSMVLIQQGSFVEARRFLEQSRQLSSELGDELGVAISLNHLGDIAFEERQLVQAAGYYRACLAIAQRLGSAHLIAVCLDGLAAVAQERDPQGAALLLGAADGIYQRIAVERELSIEPRYRATLASLRERLGAPALDALWSSGSALSLEHAMQQALRVGKEIDR